MTRAVQARAAGWLKEGKTINGASLTTTTMIITITVITNLRDSHPPNSSKYYKSRLLEAAIPGTAAPAALAASLAAPFLARGGGVGGPMRVGPAGGAGPGGRGGAPSPRPRVGTRGRRGRAGGWAGRARASAPHAPRSQPSIPRRREPWRRSQSVSGGSSSRRSRRRSGRRGDARRAA